MSEINNSPASTAASDTSVQTEIQNTPEQTPESTPVTQANKKKFKLKVDGNEEEMELDLNDEVALTRHLQMSKVAQKRMNEAALTRKQAEQFIQALQNDPMRVLSNPKLMGEEKFQKIAEEFLARKIQEQMMSPEEKRQREMEERLRNYEEQDKQTREKAEQEQVQQLQAHYQEQYTKTITEALETSNLPKNPFTVKRMAQLLQQNIKHGLELEPKHLAQLVREDYQREIASLIGSSNPEQIISMFGEEVTNKLRKHDLDNLRQKLTHDSIRNTTRQVDNQVDQAKPRKWSDFNEEMKKKIK